MTRNMRRWRGLILCLLVIGLLFNQSIYKLYIEIRYPYKYGEIIEKYAAEYDLDPLLVAAVINVESKFDEKAQSGKGAKGLMQVIDKTGAWAASEIGIQDFQEEQLYDAETNIRIGCWYLDRLGYEFDNELLLILAAYNGGSGNVSKWLRNPDYSNDGEKLDTIPFKETREYVLKVTDQFEKYQEYHE